MRSVTLANGLLSTSRVGFGTSALHHLRLDRARARLLDQCFSLGIRYFDTAPLYGHELAERQLGRFMRSRRGEVVVATKFGILSNSFMSRSSARLYAGLLVRSAAVRIGRNWPGPWVRDYGTSSMLRSLERSLKNLATDHVDVLFVHEPSFDSAGFCDETVRALQRIRAEGKARFIGLSGAAENCLAIARAHPSLAQVLQIDVGSDPTAVEKLRNAGLEPAVTFGHFRAALQSAPGAVQQGLVHRRLQAAARDNPHGVLLFSARSAARVAQVCTLVHAIDGARSAS